MIPTNLKRVDCPHFPCYIEAVSASKHTLSTKLLLICSTKLQVVEYPLIGYCVIGQTPYSSGNSPKAIGQSASYPLSSGHSTLAVVGY